ncbi:MAG: DUF6616 family protein [Stenotrophomonas sp.]|uniref:DUF6616 family protein n=1 Tax=Stenotrophomonas sp. TaxID=69392 RepID=UPI003D6CA864
MPYTLIELYTATPAWTALDAFSRGAFFARIGAGMQDIDPARITPIAMGRVDQDVANASAEQFYAVWQCSERLDADALLAAIAATGWHTYFTTTHALGATGNLQSHLAELAALPRQ